MQLGSLSSRIQHSKQEKGLDPTRDCKKRLQSLPEFLLALATHRSMPESVSHAFGAAHLNHSKNRKDVKTGSNSCQATWWAASNPAVALAFLARLRVLLASFFRCEKNVNQTHEGAFFAPGHLGRVWVSRMLARSDTVVRMQSFREVTGSGCLHMCTSQQAHKSLIGGSSAP